MALKVQLFVTLLVLLFLIKIEGDSTSKLVNKNATTTTVSSSPKLNQVGEDPQTDCSNMPWICSQGEFPPRFICCGKSCVDVTSDVNNCGICGIRCQLNWQCCNRLCINTNLSPLNCGKCGRVCPIGRLCLFGTCAFEQAFPPLLPPGLPEKNPPQPKLHQPQNPKQAPPME